MPRMMMITFLIVTFVSARSTSATDLEAERQACSGLPISRFEKRFPPTVKRLAFANPMVGPFVELWRAGSRPDLPKRPERVIIYALPELPLIIAYQERHCVIAYLTIESAVLWHWLRPRMGWAV